MAAIHHKAQCWNAPLAYWLLRLLGASSAGRRERPLCQSRSYSEHPSQEHRPKRPLLSSYGYRPFSGSEQQARATCQSEGRLLRSQEG